MRSFLWATKEGIIGKEEGIQARHFEKVGKPWLSSPKASAQENGDTVETNVVNSSEHAEQREGVSPTSEAMVE